MGTIKTKMVTFDSDLLSKNVYQEFVNDIDIEEEEIAAAYSSYRVCPKRTDKDGVPLEIDTTTVVLKNGYKFILDIHKSDFDDLRKACKIF